MTISQFLAAIFGNSSRQNAIQTMPQGPQGMQPRAGNSFGRSPAPTTGEIAATSEAIFGPTMTPNIGPGGTVIATDGTEFGHPIKSFGKQPAQTAAQSPRQSSSIPATHSPYGKGGSQRH